MTKFLIIFFILLLNDAYFQKIILLRSVVQFLVKKLKSLTIFNIYFSYLVIILLVIILLVISYHFDNDNIY